MTEPELRRALTELADQYSDGEPIVSLYLDTHWRNEKQRERARVFVHQAVKQAIHRHIAIPQIDAFRRTLGRVFKAAIELIEQSDHTREERDRGVVIFACEALELWRIHTAPRPFRNELCDDARPHLLQLARLADDVEPAVIALVHDRGAQLYQVALGAIVSAPTVEGPVPKRHGEGGRVRGGAVPPPKGGHAGSAGATYYERERKNQRHVEEVIDRLRREVVRLVRQIWERDPRAHVVLVGTSEKVAAFERELPQAMRERVLARLPRPPGKEGWRGSGQVGLVEEVVSKLAEHERRVEAEAVEHVIGEALRGGMAVLGPEDVVLAVNERRVHRLVLEEDFERSGWRCRNCAALGTTHDEVCSFCQGPLARVEALGEELMGRVIVEDGEVEVVAHTNRLHSYDGVAALLRQAHGGGLSGAPAGGSNTTPASPPS